MVKVVILFGKVISDQGTLVEGDIMDIPEDKIVAFGSQVRRVQKAPSVPPPVKEPELPPAPEQAPLTGEPEEPVEKKKGK